MFKYLAVEDIPESFKAKLEVEGFSKIESCSNSSISLLEEAQDIAIEETKEVTEEATEGWSL